MLNVTAFLIIRCHERELKSLLPSVEHQALQLTMFVHRGANPLLVRGNEEMPLVLISEWLIQLHALGGICGEGDPRRGYPFLLCPDPAFALARCGKSRVCW